MKNDVSFHIALGRYSLHPALGRCSFADERRRFHIALGLHRANKEAGKLHLSITKALHPALGRYSLANENVLFSLIMRLDAELLAVKSRRFFAPCSKAV